MLIIGIAGGTGSGKTTVVRKIMEHLPSGEVGVISQDNYYKDSSHVPMEDRQKINFDEPAAFDWDLLLSHLNALKNGESIDMPTYDYITSSRQKETIHMGPHDVVVLEGILVMSDQRVRDLMDIKVFVDADADDTANGYRTLRTSAQTNASATYRAYKTLLRPHHPSRRT